MTEDAGRKFPQLTTERLVLRELTMDDVDWYKSHFSISEIVTGSGFAAPADGDAAREEFERYILGPWNQGTGLRWGITLKKDSRVIGSAGFYKWENEPHRKAEMGYDLNPTHWGKGIMTEALGAIISYGFDEMNLNRITIFVISENERSVKLARRLGFVKEGVIRESEFFDGRFIDDVMFSILKSDWRRRVADDIGHPTGPGCPNSRHD